MSSGLFRSRGLRFAVAALAAFFAISAFAWGGGHDTVARSVLRKLPPEWKARFKPEWNKAFLTVAHLPDRCGLELLKESERKWFEDNLGLKQDASLFHRPEYVFGEVERMVAAIRNGDDYSLFLYLSSVSHSIADPAACNHDPLVHMLTYIWGGQTGVRVLPKTGRVMPVDCDFVEKDTATKEVLAQRLAALKIPEVPPSLTREELFGQIAAWEVAALDVCSRSSGRIVSEGAKYVVHGDGESKKDAADALCDLGLYAVEKTLYVFAAAVKFAAEDSPAVDPKSFARIARRAVAAERAKILKRPMANDVWARPYWPDADRPCRFAVMYDPTAHMNHSACLPIGRIIGCQTVGSVRKLCPELNAGIVDMREFATKGLPADDSNSPRYLMAFGDVNGSGGFDVKDFYRQLEDFAKGGGKVIWVEGRAPGCLFGKEVPAAMDDGGRRDGYCRPAYPCGGAEALMDCSLAVVGGGEERVWKYLRKPTGSAGWFWHGSHWTFDATRIPKDVEPFVELRSPKNTWLVGVRRGGVTYLPLNALFAYCLTEEGPSFDPFVLRLDSAGEEILRRIGLNPLAEGMISPEEVR